MYFPGARDRIKTKTTFCYISCEEETQKKAIKQIILGVIKAENKNKVMKRSRDY